MDNDGRQSRPVKRHHSRSSSSSSSSSEGYRKDHRNKKKRYRSSSSSTSYEKKEKRLKKHKKKKRARSSSSSSDCNRKHKKDKKKKKKDRKKKKKSKKFEKYLKSKRKDSVANEGVNKNANHSDCSEKLKVYANEDTSKEEKISMTSHDCNMVPKKRVMAPMTKEEYEKQQSIVRRVYDPETGRNRLVKGDGEILEEIVSYARHKEINKIATRMDGESFSSAIGMKR